MSEIQEVELVQASGHSALKVVKEPPDFSNIAAHAKRFKLGSRGTVIRGALRRNGDEDWLCFTATGDKLHFSIESPRRPSGSVLEVFLGIANVPQHPKVTVTPDYSGACKPAKGVPCYLRIRPEWAGASCPGYEVSVTRG